MASFQLRSTLGGSTLRGGDALRSPQSAPLLSEPFGLTDSLSYLQGAERTLTDALGIDDPGAAELDRGDRVGLSDELVMTGTFTPSVPPFRLSAVPVPAGLSARGIRTRAATPVPSPIGAAR